MRVIIAGSRTVTDYQLIKTIIQNSGWEIAEIVSGGAKGADQLGERYAREHGIRLRRFPADWERYGKSAGYRRNVLMATYADALIAIHENNSRGTAHMIHLMQQQSKPTIIERR